MSKINLLEQIVNKLPKGLNDLEIARFLYLELCRVVTFSTKFNNTDDASFSFMYTQKVDALKLVNTEVNCRMWSSIYSQLLDVVNIKNEIVDNGHQYVKFYIDGKEWIADATYGYYTDLSRVKNNDKTCGFGYSLYQGSDRSSISMDKEYLDMLDSVDSKLGYNNNQMEELMELRKLFTDIKDGKTDINSLSTHYINDPISFKLEYLFCHLGKLNCGYYEAKDYVYNLEKCLFNSDELSFIKAVELKRTNKDKSVDILQCIYTIGDSPRYYLLGSNLPVLSINRDQLMYLATNGFGIFEGKKIDGISYPLNFKPGSVSKYSKFKIYKDSKLSNNKILNDYVRVR